MSMAVDATFSASHPCRLLPFTEPPPPPPRPTSQQAGGGASEVGRWSVDRARSPRRDAHSQPWATFRASERARGRCGSSTTTTSLCSLSGRRHWSEWRSRSLRSSCRRRRRLGRRRGRTREQPFARPLTKAAAASDGSTGVSLIRGREGLMITRAKERTESSERRSCLFCNSSLAAKKGAAPSPQSRCANHPQSGFQNHMHDCGSRRPAAAVRRPDNA